MKITPLYIYILLPFSLIHWQCTEDKMAPHQTEPNYSDAIQIKKGDYWIYEVTSTDLGTGEVASLGMNSTTYTAEKTKNNQEYLYYYNGNYGLNGYIRDSLHYIIDEYGGGAFQVKILPIHYLIQPRPTVRWFM